MMNLTLGIVGATGAVGQTALELLTDDCKGFKAGLVRAFASRASVGKKVAFGQSSLPVEETTLEALRQCDAVLFASEAHVSKEFIPELARSGVLCVDKSSAFREHAEVPLVVPEVNGHRLAPERLGAFPVVANPNCCATPLVVALKPLHDAYGVVRVIVSTYQSVSGSGKPGIDTLHEEAKRFFGAEDLAASASAVYPKTIAFNVMPFVAKILPDGDTDEESKIVYETRKILELPQLRISATSVRVPTFVGHAESVTVELGRKAPLSEIRALLSGAPGIAFVDEFATPDEDAEVTQFPTPRDVHGKDPVFVGRVREAQVFDNGVALWVAADNLRKGAALNAIQIIDQCSRNGTLSLLRAKRGV